MARSASSDPYLNFRFHLTDPAGGHLDPVAGFQSVTVPDITLDPAEYREGIFRWTQKYPGTPTIGEVQLMKGVFKRESDFLKWIMGIINGAISEYRTDLMLMEFHIQDEYGINGKPSRIMRMEECFPTSCKPVADKDSTGAEVAIQEMGLVCESFSVELIPA